MSRNLTRLLAVFVIVFVVRESSPLAAGPWMNVTGNLANMPSECGNLTILSPVPGSDTIVAGVALKGLWANSSGTTWSQLGTGTGSAVITNRPSWIVHDAANAGVFWESGIYNGGGVYKTTNGGNTFSRLGSVAHNDYVSVDFSDPNRQTLLAGGHEQSQTVYKSTNGGQAWTNIGLNLPANTKFSGNPVILNTQTYLVNAQGWGGGSAGIYRTTNGGTSWQQVSALGPSGPPLVTSSGAIYWNLGSSLLKSTDSGSTWVQVGSGLQPVPPIELPDGTLASLGANNLVVSADGGATWTALGPTLPYTPQGLIYSSNRKAFFIWRWDCGEIVLPNAIMRMDHEVTGRVPSAPTNLRIVGGLQN
jgi:photosystem II stability/assembly factor-like uncharacterized protein